MRWWFVSLSFVLIVVEMGTASDSTAAEQLPRTFVGRVIAGGDVRLSPDGLSCRLVLTETQRMYGTMESALGEQQPVEIWTETRAGVLTFLFNPERSFPLPASTVVVSCVTSSDGSTPVPCAP